MEQGTKEWHDWRNTGIGSSDASVIMGTSPWSTPRQLAETKKGLRERPEKNFAMQRGLDLEHEARLAYEKKMDEIMQAECIVHKKHKWMKASLDGINISRDIILEIKCPGKADHQKAVNGEIPEKYYAQVQHQLMTAEIKVAHYWSYYKPKGEEGEGALVIVDQDPEYQADLFDRELEFYEKYIKGDELPDPIDKDIVMRDDDLWKALTDQYKEAKDALDEISAVEKELKKRLYELAGENTAQGNGIRITRYFKKGRVNYDKIPELKDIDLEQYRGKGKIEQKLNILKDDQK